MRTRFVIVPLRAREDDYLSEIAKEKGLSKETVMRQALYCYQIIESRRVSDPELVQRLFDTGLSKKEAPKYGA